MKFYQTIAFVLFSTLTFSTYAGGVPQKDDKKSIKASSEPMTKTMNQEASAIATLTEIELDCELEGLCIYNKLNELVKKDPNSVYQDTLASLKANMKKIEFEHEHCNSEQIRTTRKVIVNCTRAALNIELAKAKGDSKILKQDIESCVAQKGKELAEKGNIYAQDMLASSAQIKVNKDEYEKYKAMVEKQKGTSEYKIFTECSTISKKK